MFCEGGGGVGGSGRRNMFVGGAEESFWAAEFSKAKSSRSPLESSRVLSIPLGSSWVLSGPLRSSWVVSGPLGASWVLSAPLGSSGVLSDPLGSSRAV